ncbi:hypothetical protein PISMIDRAFT_677169, partial [Pisolithus microcarpus 441]
TFYHRGMDVLANSWTHPCHCESGSIGPLLFDTCKKLAVLDTQNSFIDSWVLGIRSGN